MYHVYCETADVETITPDYNDARREFMAYVREYPGQQVDFDQIEGATFEQVRAGDFDGKRTRIMQSPAEG